MVAAIAGGLNNPSVKARLDEIEAERAAFLAESEKPAPAAINLHPGAASLWRAKIRALRAALDEGDGAEMTRETLRSLIERVTLVPDRTAEYGFVVELEGRLAEMLQVVGIKKADAELVDSASAVSGQLVAGARNASWLVTPMTVPATTSQASPHISELDLLPGQSAGFGFTICLPVW
jgi:hypothetical protein